MSEHMAQDHITDAVVGETAEHQVEQVQHADHHHVQDDNNVAGHVVFSDDNECAIMDSDDSASEPSFGCAMTHQHDRDVAALGADPWADFDQSFCDIHGDLIVAPRIGPWADFDDSFCDIHGDLLSAPLQPHKGAPSEQYVDEFNYPTAPVPRGRVVSFWDEHPAPLRPRRATPSEQNVDEFNYPTAPVPWGHVVSFWDQYYEHPTYQVRRNTAGKLELVDVVEPTAQSEQPKRPKRGPLTLMRDLVHSATRDRDWVR